MFQGRIRSLPPAVSTACPLLLARSGITLTPASGPLPPSDRERAVACGRLNDPASSPHLGGHDPACRDPCATLEHTLTASGGWGMGVFGGHYSAAHNGPALGVETRCPHPTPPPPPLLFPCSGFPPATVLGAGDNQVLFSLEPASPPTGAAGVNRPSGGHLLGLGWGQAVPGQLRSEQ